MNLEELSDQDLHEELQKAGLVEKLTTSPEWRMLKEAGDRIVDRAINEFANSVKADDYIRIIELQTIIRKYKYGLISEVAVLKQESEVLYAEAENRGMFEYIESLWKK